MSGIAVRFDTPITLEVAELRYRSGRKPRGDDLLAIHKIEDGIAHVTVTRRGHRPKSYQAPLKLVIEIPDAQVYRIAVMRIKFSCRATWNPARSSHRPSEARSRSRCRPRAVGMPISEMQRSANQAVHLEVRAGIRPHANAIPCSDCGHIYAPGERRHEWHHHLGYEREHWFSVLVVCTSCHGKHSAKALWTHCKRGHEFSAANTGRNKNGTRRCRECAKLRERNRKRRMKRRG